MKRLRVADFDMAVEERGSGVPLLLVHGFPLDHSMWSEQLAGLADVGRIIAPDLRGFGASTRGAMPMSMAQLADDLAGLLDALEIEEPVVLCGLSMGGYVAWQFWQKHRARLRALILCDTRAAADTSDAAAGRRKTAQSVLEKGAALLAEAMLPKLFSLRATATQAPSVERIRETIVATAPQTIADALTAMAARHDMTGELANVNVPTLAICGSDDAITPAEEMRTMAAAMPNAQFVEVFGAGHMAPLESPGEVNDAIRAFLKRV